MCDSDSRKIDWKDLQALSHEQDLLNKHAQAINSALIMMCASFAKLNPISGTGLEWSGVDGGADGGVDGGVDGVELELYNPQI